MEQLGMFGFARTLDMHVVSAHERLQADGSSVFVSEHLRWNRGRVERVPVVRFRSFVPSAGQLSMFARDASPPSEAPDEPLPELQGEQLGFL